MITSDGRRIVVVGSEGITVREATTLEVLERLPGAGVGDSLTGRRARRGGPPCRHRHRRRFTPDGRAVITTGGGDGDGRPLP
jgi:hypothetical protein